LVKIRHLSGDRPSRLKPGDLAVVTLVRNGVDYIEEFIEYYKALGIEHIFIIDNDSEDQTIEKATHHNNVTIYSTSLSFSRFENLIRRFFLLKNFRNSWVLCVDIDEFFDYPGRETMSLKDFIGYLTLGRYTAVTACMLDMFSVHSGNEVRGGKFSDVYTHTNIADIQKDNYPNFWFTRSNIVPNGLYMFNGGLRKQMVGPDRVIGLTKHPLLFIGDGIIPFTDPHFCARARLADVQCVLLHYKFIGNFLERARSIATDPRAHPYWAAENAAYVQHFSGARSRLPDSSAYRYISADDLADKSLLFMSENFRRYQGQFGKS
jgi:Glycosyl transferase family 2